MKPKGEMTNVVVQVEKTNIENSMKWRLIYLKRLHSWEQVKGREWTPPGH